MRLVTRGILREMWWPFLAALALTNMVLLLLQLLQLGDIVFGSAFSPAFLMRLVLFTAPHYLVITLPLSAVAAAIMVFGRMADGNELLALEAGGLAPAALYPAPVALGILASLASLVVQLWAEPWGMRTLYGRTIEVLKDNTSYNFQEGVFNDDVPGTVIYFDRKGRTGREWQKIFIYQTDRTQNPVLLSARTGEVRPAEGTRGLAIDLRDGVVHQATPQAGEYRTIEFARNTLTVDIGKIVEQKTKFFQTAQMLYPAEFAREIANKKDAGERRKLGVLFKAKFATAFAPLFLMLAAVPLCAARFRSGRPANIALVLGLMMVYYLALRISTAAGEQGRLEAWAAAVIPDALLVALAFAAPRLRGAAR
jgi:lipopolysaccharide export system permease protein